MHDSDELDDILNEIRNHQNPHTEDAPPEPEPPQTVDMPLFDHADAPHACAEGFAGESHPAHRGSRGNTGRLRYAGDHAHRRRQRRCIYQCIFRHGGDPGRGSLHAPDPTPW